MDNLWAPWRAAYITQLKGPSDKVCVFCRIAAEKKDKKNYILLRSRFSYAVLNLYPYNNGHLLIVPYRHVKDILELKKDERDDFYDLLESAKRLLDETLKPGGYNIGMNLGRIAGAGFPGHLHLHVVPRWRGDVNFMPVTGNTKVISQSLKALFKRLHHAHKKRN